MARSCGKATDFRAQIFLGCYWVTGSIFKRSLLIIGEKKFFLVYVVYMYVQIVHIIPLVIISLCSSSPNLLLVTVKVIALSTFLCVCSRGNSAELNVGQLYGTEKYFGKTFHYTRLRRRLPLTFSLHFNVLITHEGPERVIILLMRVKCFDPASH